MRTFGTRPDILLMRANVGVAVPSRIVHEALARLRLGDVVGAVDILANGQVIRYGVPGQADLTGLIAGGRRLEIEVKSETGRQSDEQRHYQHWIESRGGLYILARSVDDVRMGLQIDDR